VFYVTNENGEVLFKTIKNIAKIEGLNPETDYTFKVIVGYSKELQLHSLEEISSKRCSESVSLSIRTPPLNVLEQTKNQFKYNGRFEDNTIKK